MGSGLPGDLHAVQCRGRARDLDGEAGTISSADVVALEDADASAAWASSRPSGPQPLAQGGEQCARRPAWRATQPGVAPIFAARGWRRATGSTSAGELGFEVGVGKRVLQGADGVVDTLTSIAPAVFQHRGDAHGGFVDGVVDRRLHLVAQRHDPRIR